ncbi:MAG: phosphoribosylglycinamide formyltransferase [Thermoleophilaceae bacterium]|nr:phosphoribosylglycinamide formyltransferase [Thermoleophilaceae bacterium]
MRVGVLVSGEGSNLQALLDKLHGKGEVEVVAVGSSTEGARGLERAHAAGVEAQAFPYAEIGGREARDLAMGDWLEEREVELLVLAGFMEVLSPAFVRRFAGRMINVHPSLLPAFPGVRAIEQAIEYGVRVTGVTVHFVEEAVDTGPIVLQRSLELPYPAGIAEVETQLHRIEHELLPRAVLLFARDRVKVVEGSRRVEVDDAGD